MAAPPPAPPRPYFFYGNRRPSQNRPVVRGGVFTNRKTVILRRRPQILTAPPADPHKWNPYSPSPPDSAPSPSETFFSTGRRLSPIARFIVDSFRKHKKWGPAVAAELQKLRRVTPALVAEVLKVESDPVMGSKFFTWAGRQKGFSHNFASYNAFTYCLNRANRYRSADEVPELMNLQGKPPTEKQFEILIRMHFDANRGLRVFYVYQKMKKFGVTPRVFLYNKIMDSLVKTNHLDLALSVYHDFQENGLVEETVTFMILAKGFCRAARIDELLEILGKMRSRLCKPDVFAYTALIRILVEGGNLDGCLRIWSEMQRDDVEPDVMAYTTLVTALCKENATDKAIEFFHQMKSKSLLIDRAVYRALVDGLLADGKVGSACDLLKEMTEEGYRADLSIYNSLIAGLCTANRVDKAHKLFNFAVQEGLVPEFETLNPLLLSFAEEGRTEDFHKLLHRMTQLGLNVMVNLRNFFSSMIEKGGKEHKALMLFNLLKADGFIDLSVFNILIKGLHKVGEVCKALSLYQELKVSDMKPDSCTYSIMIPCFVDDGDIEEACLCYNKIQEMASIPSIPAYCSLVRGLCRTGEINAAILLVRDCLGNVANGPMEFKYALTIIRACKSGLTENVIKVFDEMKQQDVPFEDIIWCSVIYGFGRHGSIGEARKVFSHMRKCDIITEAKVIVYDEVLVDHVKKTTAGLVLSGLKFFGLESKLNKLKSNSKAPYAIGRPLIPTSGLAGGKT